jgi:sugar-phosphatase
MDCAKKLQALPMECICFEDSFNGMIAAKAARMKCIVLPAADQYELAKWGAADRKLRSLLEFNGDLLKQI